MHIVSANQNNIRPKMSTYVTITQVVSSTLNISVTNAKTNDTTNIQKSEIDLRNLTDLKDNGFILDGSASWLDTNQATTVDTGKIGIRSHIGQAMTVSVSSSTSLNALTMRVIGQGTLTANGDTYDIREFMVIPMNSTNITMTFTPTSATDRIEIDDIQSGVSISFDDDSLIACNLDLASDLNLVGGDYQVSSIEIQGYYPYDISEAVSSMGDGVPITYQCGYPEDMSAIRRFYINEEVTQKNGIITVKGVDASSRLDQYTQTESTWSTTPSTAHRDMYRKMASWITSAKIHLISKETEPSRYGSDNYKTCVVLREASFKEHIQEMMTYCKGNGFYPRFIDGGIPKLSWSRPTPMWTIAEEDVGDHEIQVERNINKIYGNDKEYPLRDTLEVNSKKVTIGTRRIKKGNNYSINYEHNLYDSVTFDTSLASINDQTLHSLNVKAKKTTKSVKYKVQSGWTTKKKQYKEGAVPKAIKKAKGYKVVSKSKNTITVQWKEPKYITKTKYVPTLVVKGYKVDTILSGGNTIGINRMGITKEIDNKIYGQFTCKDAQDNTFTKPSYSSIFLASNIKGSFTWKGNPHIQPRDVFTFEKMDGTSEICTIERIETTHSGGGMSSKITYRKGII